MIGFLRDIGVNVALTTPLVGAYTMFALGIVFIYRASKVLNLAHGAMAMVPAYVAFSVAGPAGRLPAVVAALMTGGAIGLTSERFVVRRLRNASPTAQTVGTVAVLGLLIALAARIWGTTPTRGPNVFPDRTFRMGDSLLQLGDIGLLATALLLVGVFVAVFRYTGLGLAMRCTADNRRAAWLMGMNPDRTTAVAWFFAGLLAALGGVLLAASTNLHPFNLALQVLPAFVAALIGGLTSVHGALFGSIIVGLTLGIVPVLGEVGSQVGAPQVALALLAFVVMSLRGLRYSPSESSSSL